MRARVNPSKGTNGLPVWARLADATVLVLLALTVWAALFGGIRFRVAGARLSATSVWRLSLETAVLFALRHLLVPQHPLYERVLVGVSSARSRWPALAAVLPVFLATRLSVLAVGYLAVIMIGYPSGSPPFRISENEFWNLPARWDTGWYLGIAEDGYSWSRRVQDQQNLNFFPAFPMLMRIGRVLLGRLFPAGTRYAWSGVLISLAAFFWALLYLYRLTRDRHNADVAVGAVTFLAAYPFALFYSAAYSESVFLLAAVAAFYHFRRDEMVLAGAWGLMVGLVRPNGCLVSVPLAVFALSPIWPHRHRPNLAPAVASVPPIRTVPALVAAVMPIVGMLIYSMVAFRMTGHPFIWAELQRMAWGRTFQGLDDSLLRHFQLIADLGLLRYTATWPGDAINFIAALFAICSIWPVTRRVGLADGLFVATNTFVPLFNGGLVSMGRFTSVLFPAFVWLGLSIPAHYRPVLVAVFAIGQGLAAALFFTWRALF